MTILSGREGAEKIRQELKEEIETSGLVPGLAVLLVGGEPASELYVRLKEKAAEEVGVRMVVRREEMLSTEEAIAQVAAWNEDASIHGIIVQLPLPDELGTDAIIAAIAPEKDVDGFHPQNRSALLAGTGHVFSPVHLAALTLVARSGLSLNGTRALILGKSPIFTEPLAYLLKRTGAFVDVENEKPAPYILKEAKLVITALGLPWVLTGPELDPEAVIIDISTCKRLDGSVVGDVETASLLPSQHASPVPGGVGPLTIAFLLKNAVEAAKRMAMEAVEEESRG